MKTIVIGCLSTCAALALCAAPAPAFAQDEEEASAAASDETAPPADGETYTPDFFARFAPRNALDMLNQVPGFTINQSDQGRGLGQANQNVLLNSERLASKSDSVLDQLSRIPADRVVRIEIVDGAKFGIPGLSGQVANVVTKGGSISGRFEYRAVFRPRYAKPSYGGGEVSVSGSGDNLEWSAAYSHGTGRGGAGGGRGTLIYDGMGNLTETREKLLYFKGEFPQLNARIKWTPPGDTIVNLSATYGRSYTRFVDNEYRHPIGDVDYHRDFKNIDKGYSYDISGDVEFGLGPGRLKLIGIERFDQSDGPATSYYIFDNGSTTLGSRFWTDSKSGERIGRAEFRWDMLGGNWELDGEAAFNRLDRIATFGPLLPNGEFDNQPLPAGGGNVTEDRYESILTHNRTLADGLTLQVGAGAEYSKLSQTGPNGLTREFWRPKGSLTLAWTPEKGLDISLKAARTVGQLSFGTFLATVDLQNNNSNAGNVKLVPQQAWEGELQVKKNLGKWGSATLRGYGQLIEDYIDIIPVPGGESPGNIDGTAKLLGISLNATINLDPLGWNGAKITTSTAYEHTSLPDPLTGQHRPFSGQTYLNHNSTLRWDVPKSNWAFGAGFQSQLNEDYVRLYETGVNYEGPVYTYGFIENKDVFGLTVNLNVFNITSGESINKRYVYGGLRDRSPLIFIEDVKNNVSKIFRIQVKGNF
ncbi:hypothetical protein GRI89_01150 [Altererythrobacter salegens]|uniref:TonB-dependent receptor plug domain-containing protein n=1 Tax=Croceibacterium salegens TaxID=1737568 RepID=A0A6I4SQL5_9SPHN|nr:hypothetical protein [Croceibacterium salegens]MXO58153.1 hypothetical protein [Croceibacterium salegens]